MTATYSDRLVLRWKEADEADDADERDIAFARLMRHCMRLPVTRRARQQTFTSVAGHSPRWADEEEQAIRRAVWRAAKRWDPSRGVSFDAYVSRGIKMALHDFWRQEAWIEDLQLHVPVSEWKRYRRLVASRPDWQSGCPSDCPVELWLACNPVPLSSSAPALAVWDIYEDVDEA